MTVILRQALLTLICVFALTTSAQELPSATDVTAINIDTFIDALPKDRISDRAIRVVDVGGYNVGVYGVFRPQTRPGRPIRHQTSITEIYYIVSGTGTLVTGGVIEEEESISDGASRQVVPGDVIVIPGYTPHWFSSLDTDIRYLIIRADPESLLGLR